MKLKTKHVSVDIESWGKRAGYDIRSIGAVEFDFTVGAVGGKFDSYDFPTKDEDFDPTRCFYVACNNPLMGLYSKDHHTNKELSLIGGAHRKYNLKRDPETVDWWNGPQQEEASRDAFANPIDLKEALIKFSEFLLNLSEDIRDGQAYDICLWSHGAAFDPPMLVEAFEVCGVPWPLFYRSPRDTRTVFDDAGIEDHSAHLKKHKYGVLHHSLHDAITQARGINGAKLTIFNWEEQSSRFLELAKVIDNQTKTIELYTRTLADRKYMLNAMYELLGPKAKQVVDKWTAQGVTRTHTTWGPEAINMTGEERAQVLLDFEAAPKTEIVDLDRSLTTAKFDDSLTKRD